jgi:hypothetical protein
MTGKVYEFKPKSRDCLLTCPHCGQQEYSIYINIIRGDNTAAAQLICLTEDCEFTMLTVMALGEDYQE